MEINFDEIIRQQGHEVLIHTPHCVEWKLSHKNCNGCKSELGCCKSVAMLGVSTSQMPYQPKDFNDFQKMHEAIQDKLDKILEAKTLDEVKAVRW